MELPYLSRNVAVLLAFLLLPAGVHAAERHAGAATARTRVVVQVSDNDEQKWKLALNNVKNMQQDLGMENVDIEVVAYGPGINMLKAGSPVGKRVSQAVESGVKIAACQNTMKAQKLGKSDMLPGIGYVRAGVVEIIRKQNEGYAYLRP